MSWELPSRISLREVGPRDGLQNEDPIPTDAKVSLVDALSLTGVERIEAVSFVRPSAIAANSPVAVRAAKRALRNGWGVTLESALDIEDAAWRTAALSGDRREGIAAFADKRAPQWPGE